MRDKVICQPSGPRCDMCDLSTKGLCPSARVVKNRKPVVFIKPDQESPAKVEVALEEDVELDANGSIKEEQEELSP
jgi:endonuclease-3